MPDYNDLTNFTNVNILKNILTESKSLTDIANDLYLSRPEVSRHLTVLRTLSLVEKDENMNVITALGSLLVELLSPLDFILLHYNFFQDHPLINFPSELLYGINSLKHSKLITGIGIIFQKYIELAQEHHRSLKCMMNTPIPNIAKVKYVEGLFIVPVHANSPSLDHNELAKELDNYELRQLPEINYDIFILENSYGFIYFPDKNGLPDNNACLFIDDIEGITFYYPFGVIFGLNRLFSDK
jgi:hypothetical protein